MVITTAMLNPIKAATVAKFNTDVANVEVSTNGSTPTVNDTTQGGTTRSETAYNKTSGASTFAASVFLDSTEFNGNTIRKVGFKKSDGTLLSSNLTNEINKTSSIEAFIEPLVTVTVNNT